MARRTSTSTRSFSPTTLVWLGVVVVILIGTVVAFLPAPTPDPSATTQRNTAGPEIGDHWHAALVISICGETQPPLPATPGDVHTHGDGLIHSHPASAQSTGANANLERYFGPTGILLTGETLQLPGGRLYRNGDLCPDGNAGRLRFLVNESEIADFSPFVTYVPRDADVVRIEFSPVS